MKRNLYFLLLLFLVIPTAGISQTLSFSAARGFYESPFQLTITCSLAGGSIRYTTDGSAPSPTSGLLYTGAIAVNSTQVIRAIGYSGSSLTPVTTHTYLFLEGVLRQPATIPGWPNNSYALGTDTATAVHDYEMDPEVVNNPAYSGIIKQGLLAIPTMSLVLNKEEFWSLYEGDSTFQTSVEIFYPDGTREQFNCGLESHSHNRLKRSLKLDLKSSTTSNLFRKAPFNDAGTTNNFKKTKIVLRGGNNRTWARNWNPNRTAYTRDEWYRISQQAISGTGGRGTFVHLYVNGLYWGLYNPVERTDAGMLSEYFGGAFADWMALDHDGIRHGDATRYSYLVNNLIKKNLATAANYAEFKTYLDVEKFSDYLIVTWMMGMGDWPNNNYHGGMRNVPAGPFFYQAWDAEWSWDGGGGANNGAWVHPQFRTSPTGSSTIAKIWHAARQNPEFMQTFADRVYRHCFNNGPLTDAASRQRWATINNFIKTAVVAESARWGDAVGDGVTRTRDTHWTPEVNRVDALMNGNVSRFIDALVAQGYYPSLAPPTLSQEGGEVAPGYQLTLTNPNAGGTIYYTTDGTDPQAAGGALSPGARAYSGPIAINGSLTLKTRVLQASSWSALHQASFTLADLITGLYINEFMATNTKEKDEFGELEDWVEIYNANSVPVNLAGLYLTDALSNLALWQVPATDAGLTTIPAKGFIRLWADNQPAQGPLHLNLKLGASGEQLGLSQMVGGELKVLDSLSFGAQTADVSSGRYPDGSATFRTFVVPTPGSTNVIAFKTNLFLNEVLAANQTSITDEAGERSGWIEIYNQNDQAVDIGGLYLTNNPANPSLWKIPATNPAATTIPAKGYLTLWADNQPAQGVLHLGFTLDPSGGQLALNHIIGADMAAVDAATYSSQQPDVSWGRYPDASQQVKLFAQPTPAAANNLPLLSNIFINEFMASNTTLADPAGEFDDWIEIYNAGTAPVDIGGMYITDVLTNPRKYQIPTTNPAATTIPAKGFLLLWADEQAAQGATHVGLKLSAGGEQIGLFQPKGADVHLLDSYTFGAQVSNTSMGRETNGGAAFVSFASATPGASNNGVSSAPPVANAGPDQTTTLPASSVTLAGSGTDPAGAITGYAWSQVSGPNAATFSSSTVATPTVSGLVAGSYVFSLTVTNDRQASSAADQVTVTVNPAPAAAYRLNAGGPQVSNALGSFSADQYFAPAPGYTYSVTGAIAGTDHDVLYQTERSATADNGSFSYAVPVSNGQYQVVLHFAELYWWAAGQRVFDVNLEGGVVLDNYDIMKKTGTKLTATTESFVVNVTDGTLDLFFSAAASEGGVNRPKVSAIEVLPATGSNLLPVAHAGEDKTITLPTSSVLLAGAGSDADGTVSSYAWQQVSGPNTATFSSSTVATPTVSGLVAGSYVFSLTVQDDRQASSATDQVTVTVNPAPAAAYRLNAGGPQVSNALGSFTADQYFSPAPGHTYSVTSPIAGTDQDVLYQSERGSVADNGSFSYAVPVSNGQYQVVLHFAELYWWAAGQRVFDVNLEGGVVLDNYDIVKKTGTKLTATTESFVVNVTDGTLDLFFSAAASGGGVNRPTVAAMEVLPVGSNLLPVAHAGADKTITLPTNTITLTGTGTDADGSIAAYSWTQVSGPAATLVGGSTASLTAQDLVAGSYLFRLTVTDNAGAAGSDEVSVRVDPSPNAGQQVVSFTLVNADSDQDIRTLVPGETVDLAALPTQNLNIRANTNPALVGSVKFSLSGAQLRNATETAAPYALYGDSQGNYNAWVPAVGSYTVVATPYTAAGGGGTAGTPLTISFTVVKPTTSARLAAAGWQPRRLQPAALLPYPNPTRDGRFRVLLPEAVAGEVCYELISVAGASLAKGTRPAGQSGSVLEFDFSRQMHNPGMYYLRLRGNKLHSQLKLLRY